MLCAGICTHRQGTTQSVKLFIMDLGFLLKCRCFSVFQTGPSCINIWYSIVLSHQLKDLPHTHDTSHNMTWISFTIPYASQVLDHCYGSWLISVAQILETNFPQQGLWQLPVMHLGILQQVICPRKSCAVLSASLSGSRQLDLHTHCYQNVILIPIFLPVIKQFVSHSSLQLNGMRIVVMESLNEQLRQLKTSC